MPRITKRKSYKKKIDPVNIFVICEGTKDEYAYLNEFKENIPFRFREYFDLVPVPRTRTSSRPYQILEEAKNFILDNNINLSKDNAYFFMLIDKDSNFEPRNIAQTISTFREANDCNIKVLIVAPAFDVWILLHELDLSSCDQEYLDKIIKNKRVDGNKPFLKAEVSRLNLYNNRTRLIKETRKALKYENLINQKFSAFEWEELLIKSQLSEIIRAFENSNIALLDHFDEITC